MQDCNFNLQILLSHNYLAECYRLQIKRIDQNWSSFGKIQDELLQLLCIGLLENSVGKFHLFQTQCFPKRWKNSAEHFDSQSSDDAFAEPGGVNPPGLAKLLLQGLRWDFPSPLLQSHLALNSFQALNNCVISLRFVNPPCFLSTGGSEAAAQTCRGSTRAVLPSFPPPLELKQGSFPGLALHSLSWSPCANPKSLPWCCTSQKSVLCKYSLQSQRISYAQVIPHCVGPDAEGEFSSLAGWEFTSHLARQIPVLCLTGPCHWAWSQFFNPAAKNLWQQWVTSVYNCNNRE